jgi:HlyD family secretion protein
VSGTAQLKIADTSAQDVELEPASKRNRYLILGAVGTALIVALALVMPALVRWGSAEKTVSGERLRYASVGRGGFVRDISVQGRVVAGVSPTLYASEAGTITFAVQAGDRVARGELLATIDSPEITNRLEQEQSSLTAFEIALERQSIEAKQRALENTKRVDLAQVQLTAASREARRADQAYEKDAISQLDYEKAHDELQSAELAHGHAVEDAALDNERLAFELKTKQLELERQRLLVADLTRQVDELAIVSPVDGVVGNLLVEQKTAVSKNLGVLSVVDLSRFEVEIEVPEGYADDLGIGMAAQVHSNEGVYGATLVSISPEIIDNQVTGRLRFQGEPPGGLRQNQRLTTRILLEAKEDVLTVTRGQFLESGAGRIAYVVEDGLARRTPIEVGARSLNTVEILGGLEEGDEIVISSTEVFEGAETVLIGN